MEGRRVIFAYILLSVLILQMAEISVSAGKEEQEPTTRAPGDDLYPKPDINLTFDRERFETDPHPVSGGGVLITGKLHCKLPQSVPSGILCTVTLKTQCIESQKEDIRQYSFNKLTNEYDFNLYMEISTDIKGGTDVDVQIIVTWEYEQTSQSSDRPEYHWTIAHVPVYGYIGVSSIFTFDEILVDVGDWYELTFEIENFGNMDTSVRLQVLDIPEDVDLILDEYQFDLRSHQSKVIYGKLKQKSGPGKNFTFRIKADSDLLVEEPDKVYSFHVRTDDTNRVDNNISTTVLLLGFFFIFIILMTAFSLILRSRRRRGFGKYNDEYDGQQGP